MMQGATVSLALCVIYLAPGTVIVPGLFFIAVSMLKRPLAGEHHGNLRISFVTGLDGLVIIHRATGLQDSGSSLVDTDVGAVAERKECIRNNNGAR